MKKSERVPVIPDLGCVENAYGLILSLQDGIGQYDPCDGDGEFYSYDIERGGGIGDGFLNGPYEYGDGLGGGKGGGWWERTPSGYYTGT